MRALFLLLCLILPLHAQTPRIQLDGKPTEAVWAAAKSFEFTQQSPNPGAPSPYKTTAKVLLTASALYFAFECVDPHPSQITIHTMTRDAEQEGDDSVSVVLDTYGDRRTGYLFQVNAAGARLDGLISGPEHPSLDWDGIWDARVTRTPQGWTAELEIPARTLSFTEGQTAWGINLERNIARDRTVMRAFSPTLDSYLPDLSRAGRIEGVEILKQGKGLELSPFFAGRSAKDFTVPSHNWKGQPGVDVTWRVTPQMAAVFTVNTDFAETEVDSRRLNLTRFSLFFPERRSFFLEGSNQFEFGLGLGESFIPFFSRRIGLYDGQLIPIYAGVKLNGRAGRWNIGLLSVKTRDIRAVPGTNLFAGRISFDLSREFRIGTIITNGSPDGVSKNTLAGLDAVWRTSRFMGDKNLLIGAWSVLTRGGAASGNRYGWGYKVDYPNDRLDCFAQTFEFGEGLNPELGFLPRPGTRQYRTGCSFGPRPAPGSSLDWIRKYRLRNYYTRVDNLRGFNESWSFEFTPAELDLDSGDKIALKFMPQYEFLPASFEISDGVVLPVGAYRFNRGEFEFESSPHRPWVFTTQTGFGSFYTGSLLQHETGLAWTAPSGRFSAGIEAEHNFARLKEGNFVQRLYQTNLSYAFSPNVVLTSFLQYDDESYDFGQNTRLRWTLKPGNDLFLVWNRGWKRLYLSPRDKALAPEGELIAIKLRWTIRP